MYKRKIFLCYILVCISLLTSCSSNETLELNNEDIFSTSENLQFEIDKQKDAYDKAHIIDYEIIEKDDKSKDEVTVLFNVMNKSDKPIDYLHLTFKYVDKNGLDITTDEKTINCQIDANKTAYVKSNISLDDKKKSSLSRIKLTSYIYYSENMAYKVLIKNKTVSYCVLSKDEPKAKTKDKAKDKTKDKAKDKTKDKIKFDDVNIIKFEKAAIEETEDKYSVKLDIKNLSKEKVTYILYNIAYYDKNHNYLANDSRFITSTIKSEATTQNTSVFTEPYLLDKVDSYGIYLYEYRLDKKDSYGYNYYIINTLTKSVKATYIKN